MAFQSDQRIKFWHRRKKSVFWEGGAISQRADDDAHIWRWRCCWWIISAGLWSPPSLPPPRTKSHQALCPTWRLPKIWRMTDWSLESVGLEYLLDEELDTGGVPLPDRRQQGGDAMLVCGVDVCPLNNFYVIFCHFWADGELSEPIFHLWDEVLEDFELAVVTCIMQRKTSIYCSVDIDSLVSRRTFMKVEWQWNIKWLLCTSPKEKVPTLHIQKRERKGGYLAPPKKEREK